MTSRRPLQRIGLYLLALITLSGCISTQVDTPFDNTVELFKQAGQSAAFFDTAYGYAVFPTIGQAGFIVSGARGVGRVYVQGLHTGNTTMTQLSGGFLGGGRGYSQIIFLQDLAAYEDFANGNFEFGAQIGAIAITASASASAGTNVSNASASGSKNDAATASVYRRGVAVFTIARGGLMYEASITGQKFSFQPVR